jgi:threonine/homoserine/homoserine lactone efflux protein
MIEAIFEGIGYGLVLSMLIGPVFLGLLQTSISKGFTHGCCYALGVVSNDILYMLLSFWGMVQFMDSDVFRQSLKVSGAIFLIGFGAYQLIRKKAPAAKSASPETGNGYFGSALKGFMMNGLNPAVILFWVALVGAITTRYPGALHLASTVLICLVITVFSIDVLKAYGANKIRAWLNVQVLLRINQGIGIIMMLAGSVLLWKEV